MPKCQRCSTETKVYHCSWYNDQNICPTCKKEEQARIDAKCKKENPIEAPVESEADQN